MKAAVILDFHLKVSFLKQVLGSKFLNLHRQKNWQFLSSESQLV